MSGIKSACYNPFSDLVRSSAQVVGADVAQIMDAIIINNSKDSHWTDSGKNLLRGIVMHMLSTSGKPDRTPPTAQRARP